VASGEQAVSPRGKGGTFREGTRRDALKRAPTDTGNNPRRVRCQDARVGRSKPRPHKRKADELRLVFELDHVIAVVDTDGVEFAENVFAEEAVELGAQKLI
jgi:hypothetical protein